MPDLVNLRDRQCGDLRPAYAGPASCDSTSSNTVSGGMRWRITA